MSAPTPLGTYDYYDEDDDENELNAELPSRFSALSRIPEARLASNASELSSNAPEQPQQADKPESSTV